MRPQCREPLSGADVLNRPALVGPISYPKTIGSWFDTSSFAAPAAGTWGNLGFDALRGPGRNNWNLSLFTEFTLNEARGSRISSVPRASTPGTTRNSEVQAREAPSAPASAPISDPAISAQ